MGLVNLLHIKQLYDLIVRARKDRSLLADSRWWTQLFKTAWSVEEIREMLTGYKTYIMAAGLGLATAAHALGYIDDTTYSALVGFLGAGGLATLRAAVKK